MDDQFVFHRSDACDWLEMEDQLENHRSDACDWLEKEDQLDERFYSYSMLTVM
jgi:hypothetical protein